MSPRIAIIFFLCIAARTAFGQDIRFVSPLGGKYLQDYIIFRYPDCSKYDKDSKDPYCGTKTTKNHDGTDFMLRRYGQVDSLVPVYAVADGIVYSTADSLSDLEKDSVLPVSRDDYGWDLKWPKLRYGNQVVINHKDSLYTLYGNLKEYSIKVKKGDHVHAGQIIAYIGNSGYAPFPEMHFEIRAKTSNSHYYEIVNPFAGPCGRAKSLWINQPGYDTAIRIIASGFLPYVPKGYISAADVASARTDFDKSDSAITHWILMSGLHANDILRTDWYKPDMTFWFSTKTIINSKWSDYKWAWIRNPIQQHYYYGDGWICAIVVNNKLIKIEKFNIKKDKIHH